jgi:hypothetical protein
MNVAEELVSEHSCFQVEITIEKLKNIYHQVLMEFQQI